MTARLGMKRVPGGLRLESKRVKRLGFLAAFLLLLLAMIVGLEPERDFSPSRAPLTFLCFLGLASSLGAAISVRVLDVVAGELRSGWRIARWSVRGRSHSIPADAEVCLRLARAERALYQLELRCGDGAIVVDTSSLRSELEPVGREIASVLKLPFRLPLPKPEPTGESRQARN